MRKILLFFMVLTMSLGPVFSHAEDTKKEKSEKKIVQEVKKEQEKPQPKIDTGNTTWLLVSSALVMLMTPGLAFFYAGMVSRRNVVSTLLQNYIALALVGILWVTVGYSLVFTENNWFIGDLSLAFLKDMATMVYEPANVPYLAYVAFQMMFAIITPALITGAFAERVNFKSWVFIMGIWSLAVYVPVAHWVWGPGGWIAAEGGLDFAGGLVVHITAGFSGLVAGFLFGRRYNTEHTLPNDIPMIMLGAGLLWFGWFGFNAGSALTAEGLAAYAFMNTFIGGAAASLAWMVTDWIKNGKPTAVGAATGIVAGLVCITPAAGYVTITDALIMCAGVGVFCNIASSAIKRISHLDDALDVFACHGIAAVIGSVLTGVFATKAVNPSIALEGWLVSGNPQLFYVNTVGVIAVALYSMVVTYIILKVMNRIVPLTVSEEDQAIGLDKALHGERAKNSDKS